MIESESQTPPQYVIGHCLSCSSPVKVPTNASPEKKAKCPNCQTVFPLRDILDQFVPMLEIIGDDDSESLRPNNDDTPIVDQIRDYSNVADNKPRDKFVVPNQLAAGAKRKRRRRSRESSSDRTGSDRSSSSSSSNRSGSDRSSSSRSTSGSARSNSSPSRSPSRPSSVSTAPAARAVRPSRSPRSSVFESLKVVAGSLIALPIAYSILFYVFTRDPLHVAPILTEIAPALVPTAYQELPEEKKPKVLDAQIVLDDRDELGFSDDSGGSDLQELGLGMEDDLDL